MDVCSSAHQITLLIATTVSCRNLVHDLLPHLTPHEPRTSYAVDALSRHACYGVRFKHLRVEDGFGVDAIDSATPRTAKPLLEHGRRDPSVALASIN